MAETAKYEPLVPLAVPAIRSWQELLSKTPSASYLMSERSLDTKVRSLCTALFNSTACGADNARTVNIIEWLEFAFAKSKAGVSVAEVRQATEQHEVQFVKVDKGKKRDLSEMNEGVQIEESGTAPKVQVLDVEAGPSGTSGVADTSTSTENGESSEK